MTEYMIAYENIYVYFDGDGDKTDDWFQTPHKQLDDKTPDELFEIGLGFKVLRLIDKMSTD